MTSKVVFADVTMSPAEARTSAALEAEEDENANPTQGKQQPPPTSVLASDYMTQQERQYKSDSAKRKDKTSDKPVPDHPHDDPSPLTGHINVLFCSDEDDVMGLPTLTVEEGRELGGGRSGSVQLQDASDVTFVDPDTLLVTDLVNNSLLLVTTAGETIRTIRSDEIVEPWASTTTLDGRIAVAARKSGKVVLLTRDGHVESTFGAPFLSCPSGIAVTSEGNFLVTDFHNNEVFVYDSSGNYVRALGETGVTFSQPRYVTVSPLGDVIVSDSGNHRLVLFDSQLKLVKTFGRFGKADGCFKFPHAVRTDKHGSILVCDRYNDRISAFTRKGEFVRHLVTSEHKIRHPQGLALSSDMELYISHGSPKAHTIMVVDIKVR